MDAIMCRAMNITCEDHSRFSTTFGATFAFALLAIVTPPFASAQGGGRGKGNSPQRGQGAQTAENQRGRQSGVRGSEARGNDSIGGTLTPALVEHLARMREEEKLAHDVYLALAQSSGLQIFKNIAYAESQHMRTVEQLVARYSPAIAGANLPIGSFSNPQFQSLYQSLVASGNSSPRAATMVGVKIEEMDIKDLQTLLSQNLPRDISQVLERLQQASKNHLRAFTKELNRLGGTYSPQFLSQQEFNDILSSENEKTRGAERGNEKGMHQSDGQASSIKVAPQSQKGNGKRRLERK
jgi:hypothetical protein